MPGQVAVELTQGLGELLSQRVNEGGHLQGLGEHLIIGRPLSLILPLGGHIVTRIAKCLRAFDPHLFTLEGPLEPLEDTEFIVLPVALHLVVVLFDHRVAPTG
jgi:hypothetical protein